MVTNSISSLNESSILIAPIEKVLPLVAVIYACQLRAQIFELGGGWKYFRCMHNVGGGGGGGCGGDNKIAASQSSLRLDEVILIVIDGSFAKLNQKREMNLL